MTAVSPPLALTMGDPAGIGGELTLKVWESRDRGVPPFVVVDDPRRLRALASSLGIAPRIVEVDRPEAALACFGEALPVLPVWLPVPPVPGCPEPANAPTIVAAIDVAVRLATAGAAAAVVTNPIHKKSLYDAGFPFPGHTEYLAELAGGGAVPVMMLAGPTLRVVPVTVHVSLRTALATLSTEAIVEAGTITEAALRRDFAVAQPRLAVAGLNPHAGEEGALGEEERTIIAPAVTALRARGIDARGPLPPDTLFSPTARRGFDAALCMYHDQALIPIKALEFDQAVNVTLGLPFVRTSPDHGTAFDIAGRGEADPSSLLAALTLAQAIGRRRAEALR
jgi:4-hydroxythreonine-4-phosphate dehydrogenase